jgi:hypothetical protein
VTGNAIPYLIPSLLPLFCRPCVLLLLPLLLLLLRACCGAS